MRRSTTKSLFKKRLHEGIIRCYKTSVNHEECYRYEAWKKHPEEQKIMLEEAGRNPRAIFVPPNKMIRVHGSHGREIKSTGGIKSLDPPCLEEAMSHGKHPFSCSNCARQERDLKNTLQHRRSGSLNDTDNRIGLSGFNKRYVRKSELEDTLEKAEYRKRSDQKQLQEMAKVKLAPSEIKGCLLDCCIAGDDQKLVIDLVRLFQSGTANKNPVQILVL